MNKLSALNIEVANKEGISGFSAEIPAQIYNGEVALLVRDLLSTVGEDPERDGLKRTPERVARMLPELLSGYNIDLAALVNRAVFESDYKSMVVVKDIEFFSLCEHHLLPFYGKVHVAYLPSGNIIGLSKIPRLVEMFSRRLQVQERLTQQIAETLNDILDPRGVAVWVEGAHMCSMMRGVKKEQARMLTSVFIGAFEQDEKLKNEFFLQMQAGGSKSGFED